MLDTFYFYNNPNPNPNPHHTLALEEAMLTHIGAGEIVLHLYTHADTVVIGRNQNPWAECRPEILLADGGTLARRVSGGGAVFHDVHNLNFSFVACREDYNLERQLKVILDAVRSFGIDAAFSGRNDILADGRKFSGNAFCFRREGAFHHGTILIGTDTAKLEKYLAVPKDKIESKGVASVRSRVVNLGELNPSITTQLMADALKISFEAEYGRSQPYPLTDGVQATAAQLTARNASRAWLFGESPKCDIATKARFPWGGIEFLFALQNGKVADVHVFSDAMDADLIERVAPALTGVDFASPTLAQAVQQITHDQENAQIIQDIAAFLLEKGY